MVIVQVSQYTELLESVELYMKDVLEMVGHLIMTLGGRDSVQLMLMYSGTQCSLGQ